MIGPKKLSQVRTAVFDAFKRAGIDIESLDREIERVPPGKETDLETLTLLRDALARAAKTPKSRRKRKSVGHG